MGERSIPCYSHENNGTKWTQREAGGSQRGRLEKLASIDRHDRLVRIGFAVKDGTGSQQSKGECREMLEVALPLNLFPFHPKVLMTRVMPDDQDSNPLLRRFVDHAVGKIVR